jgi:adenylate cyclase
MLLEGLRLCRDAGARLDYPYFLALLAEARLSAGDADAAVQALEEALSIVEPGRGFFYEAELHRLLGLAFDQPGRAEAVTRARAAFHRALDVAAGQQARSLELRAATSLARLALAAGRPDEALEVLGPVYTRFSEGFATRDLIEADHVLERLGMPPAKTRGGRIRSRP